MFPGLGHRAIGGRDHENTTVHLCRTGDHVFYIVGVAGAVHVCIVATGGFVLNVSGVDGDPASFFFGSGIDFIVFFSLGITQSR